MPLCNITIKTKESITILDNVKSIGYQAFFGTKIKDIYYTGTKEQWNTIDKTNADIRHDTTIH